MIHDAPNKALILEYVVDAPREKAWRAYSDKAMFEKWWGPEGWSTVTKAFDFAPGGRIHYGMTCLDKNQGEWFGKESWGVMEIESINEGKSFTCKDYFSDAEGALNTEMPALTITNDFIEEEGKIKIVSRSVAGTAEQIEELLKMGVVEGFKSQLNKLALLMREV